jgi:Ca2+-binding EF-hand superfamily protein
MFLAAMFGRPSSSRSVRAFFATLLLVSAIISAQDYPQTPREYLRLMDADGDGRISEAEYVAYMSRSFLRMDTNGDGILEPSELPGGRGRPISLREFQHNLRKQFHRLDRNHDGYLSAKELAQPPG